MLVLSRKVGEKIHIGNDIVLTVVLIRGGSIRLGIEAPVTTTIVRGELVELEASKLGGKNNGN